MRLSFGGRVRTALLSATSKVLMLTLIQNLTLTMILTLTLTLTLTPTLTAPR